MVKIIPLSDPPFGPAGKIEPSKKTEQTLRNYLLIDSGGEPSLDTLIRLQEEINRHCSRELLRAFTELAYVEALRREKSEPKLAAEIYIAAALQSYRYLFDSTLSEPQNTYDADFRKMARCYNASVERLLRIMQKQEERSVLIPGRQIVLQSEDRTWTMQTQIASGRWRPEEIGNVRFASDCKLLGLKNHYGQEGLGVPVIVTRTRSDRPEEKYYPSELTFPMTLFLRPNPRGASPKQEGQYSATNGSGQRTSEAVRNIGSGASPKQEGQYSATNGSGQRTSEAVRNIGSGASPKQEGQYSANEPQAILEFHDPLTSPTIQIGRESTPLEYDFSTALAFNCNDPKVHLLGTIGLTDPGAFLEPLPQNQGHTLKGLYMIQPYDPNKIPVVMIHGLWSSPMTWLEMVNTLQTDPFIRNNCQFWFYIYPTGLPWWGSAVMLRMDLAEARLTLDPNRDDEHLDQMVLIGHSMGGLIARLQVSDGADYFAHSLATSENAPTKNQLTQTADDSPFFFEPNRSVRRVVTIATPFRGSSSVNHFSQWLANQFIDAPENLGHSLTNGDNPQSAVQNSVESLSPQNPAFDVLNDLWIPPTVALNNIVGLEEPSAFNPNPKSDGVVEQSSAHLPDAESELTVRATHMRIHTEPAAIRETHRILVEHISKMNLERLASAGAATPK